MKFIQLLETVGDEPVFETGLLLAGGVDPRDVRRQLSRWTKAGRLYQLRRGLYALAPPFQKLKPHPFVTANRMMHGSYVSCQSALAHFGLIPESVPAVTSVSGGRTARWQTPLGHFEFYHVQSKLLRSYRLIDLGEGQRAFVAIPEKALLDLVHLHAHADTPEYLRELRLQNLGQLRPDRLEELASSARRPKLQRAVAVIAALALDEAREYEPL
jgi:hypothetical protein